MTSFPVVDNFLAYSWLAGYVTFRLLHFADSQLNILTLTLVLIVGQFLRTKNTWCSVIPSALKTIQVGVVADAIFSLGRNDIAAILTSVMTTLWIALPAHDLYPSHASNVRQLETVDEISHFISNNKDGLLLCCEFKMLHSVHVSHVFADLSSDDVAKSTHCGLVDGSQSVLAGKLKVTNAGVPTIIQYSNGSEVTRQQVPDANLKSLKLKFFPYR